MLSTISTNHGVSLDVSWEIDLWGRLRASSQAALADLQRSAADLRGAQLSIAGQTSKRGSRSPRRSSRSTCRARRRQFSGIGRAGTRPVRGGHPPALDLRLALLNLSNAEARLQQRLQQLDSSTRQLEVLLGQYPDRTVDTPPSLPATTPAVPSGLPADLVGRRPDLVAAERNLAASEARLGVARTELLPQISLTAATGTATNSLRSLIDGDFQRLELPGQRRRTALAGRGGCARRSARPRPGARRLSRPYANTALAAYAEVETALAAEQFLREREQYLTTSVTQARAAERLADERYRAGLETYITVLDSQRSAFRPRLTCWRHVGCVWRTAWTSIWRWEGASSSSGRRSSWKQMKKMTPTRCLNGL